MYGHAGLESRCIMCLRLVGNYLEGVKHLCVIPLLHLKINHFISDAVQPSCAAENFQHSKPYALIASPFRTFWNIVHTLLSCEG